MLVVAYLMKLKGWRLAESYRWVKDRRPVVQLDAQDFARLVEAEKGLFGSASVCSLGELEGGGGGGGGAAGNGNTFFHLAGEDASSTGAFQFGNVTSDEGGFVFGGNQAMD